VDVFYGRPLTIKFYYFTALITFSVMLNCTNLFILQPGEIGGTPHGSIHIALSYNPATGRLGVFVFNVKDLNMLNLEEAAGRKNDGVLKS